MNPIDGHQELPGQGPIDFAEAIEAFEGLVQARTREDGRDVERVGDALVEAAPGVRIVALPCIPDATQPEILQARVVDIPQSSEHDTNEQQPQRAHQCDEEQHGHDDEASPVAREDLGVAVASKENREEVSRGEDSDEYRDARVDPAERARAFEGPVERCHELGQ